MSYRAEIHGHPDGKVAVDVAISTGTTAWKEPVHTIEVGVATRVSDISFVSPGGKLLSSRIERSGVLDRLVGNEPVQEYRISYMVEVNESGHVRIPLAVPEIPMAGAGTVIVTYYAPSPDIIAGDAFPAFQRIAPGAFVAELSNVPGHVELSLWHASEAGFRQRWVTPASLSDLVVIALLAIGSIARAARRRGREA